MLIRSSKKTKVALYVAGDATSVKNALLLLDAFWTREVRPANAEPTTVHIHAHVGIEVADVKEERGGYKSARARHGGLPATHRHRGRWRVPEEFDFPHYEFHAPADALPLSVFAAAPPKGRTICTLSVQIQSDTEVSIVISGSTWNYRTQFTTAGIGGGYANPDGDEKGPYVRAPQGCAHNRSNIARAPVYRLPGNSELSVEFRDVRSRTSTSRRRRTSKK